MQGLIRKNNRNRKLKDHLAHQAHLVHQVVKVLKRAQKKAQKRIQITLTHLKTSLIRFLLY
jgi:hypothetical protein